MEMNEKNELQARDQHESDYYSDSEIPLNDMKTNMLEEDFFNCTSASYRTKVIEIEEKNEAHEKCIPELEAEGEMPGAPETHRKRWYRYVGLLMTILSSMMFSLIGLIFKLLPSYHPLTIGSWMFLMTGVSAGISYAFNIRWNSASLSHKSSWRSMGVRKKLTVWARGLAGCSGMLFFFYALQYISIGDALVIGSSCTVFVFLFAFIFLKESCGIVPVFTIALAVIGVGIISRPPLLTGEESFVGDNLIGVAFSTASMLCVASSLILMRFLQDVHHSLINLILGSWGAVQMTGLALSIGVLRLPEGLSDGCLMTTTGLLFFIGQTFLAVALQLEEAGPVSLLRTSELVFAFVWQILFLNIVPDSFSLTGALLITVGIVTTIVRKWISGLPTDHLTRRRLAFILR